MISDRYDPADFLKAVMNCDLLRLQTVVEEELRVVDLTCRRAWNDGRSVPATAPRYLNFLRRLSSWLDAGGESRVRLSPDLRDPWRTLIHRLVDKGQLKPTALRSLGRKRTASHQGPQRPFQPAAPAPSVHALAPGLFYDPTARTPARAAPPAELGPIILPAPFAASQQTR